MNPILLATIAALLFLPGASQAQNKKKAPPSPVVTTPAASYRLTSAIELPGSVETTLRTQVAAPVAGLVADVMVREGDRVKKGQELARLDVDMLEAQRLTLEAQLAESVARGKGAALNLSRAKELFDAQLIAAEAFETAGVELAALEARTASLKASIAELDLRIRISVISAPFDGSVTRKWIEVGGWAKVGDPIVELVSLADLETNVEAPEVHLSKLQTGQRAELRFEALPGLVLQGRVRAIGAEADPDARTFSVKVSIPAGAKAVRSGMVATVRFAPSSPRTVTIVPKDALLERDEGWSVFTVAAENKAALRHVRLGESINGWTEVVGDLRPGQQVVTFGNERLRDGQDVTPQVRELPQP
jgi:membrane fusion protein (multidrug efflux system)